MAEHGADIAQEASNRPSIQLLDANGRLLRSVVLRSTGIQIGRLPASDLVLDAASVSRNHVRVEWDGNRVLVTDLGSRAGTQLGAVRLVPQVPIAWDSATMMQIGPYTLRLVDLPVLSAMPPAARPAMPIPAMLAPALPVESAPVDVAAQLLPPGEYLSITPGIPARVEVALENRGSQPEQIELDVDGVPESWVKIGNITELAPGAREVVSLYIDTPQESDSLAGSYAVTIRVLAPLRNQECAALVAQWDVQAFASNQVELNPKQIADPSQGLYAVQIANRGNRAVRYSLVARANAGDMSFALGRNQVTVNPGQSLEVPLTVQMPRRTLGTKRTYGFTIQTLGDSGEMNSDRGTFVHTPVMPLWLPLLAAPLLLLAGYFLYQAVNQPAQIASADPTRIARLTATQAVLEQTATANRQIQDATATGIAGLPFATRIVEQTALAATTTSQAIEIAMTAQATRLTPLTTQSVEVSATPTPTPTTAPTAPPTPTGTLAPTARAGTSTPVLAASPTPASTNQQQATATSTATATPTATGTPIPIAVTGITPALGDPGGGETITITGRGLAGNVLVEFGAEQATNVRCNEAGTSCTVTTPPGAGRVPVKVTSRGGTTTEQNYSYRVVVSSITPGKGSAAGNQQITITGNGFKTGTTIQIVGVAATTVNCTSRTTCTARTGVGATAGTPGSVSATVDGQTGSLANAFVYTPVLEGLNQTSGSAEGNLVVRISGAGFITGANQTQVRFGTTSAISVNCSTSSECEVRTPAGQVAGTVPVTVITGSESAGGLSYTFNLVVTGLNPATGRASTGQAVTITGFGFPPSGAKITLGTTVLSNQSCATTTSCSFSALGGQVAGKRTVKLEAVGQSATSPTEFSYTPGVTKLTQASGKASGAPAVTVEGFGFGASTETTFTFNGVPGTNVSCTNLTTCTVTPPTNQVAGVVPVAATVQGVAGDNSDREDFTFIPGIDSVVPDSIPANSVAPVVINGFGFPTGSGPYVVLDGSPRTVNCTSSIRCTLTPPGNQVARTVTVAAQVNGQTGPQTQSLTYELGGVSISPATGTESTSVTVTGFGFATTGTTITFGGVDGTGVTCTPIQCTVQPPARGTDGSVAVVVKVPSGDQATSSNQFTYQYPTPTPTLSPTPTATATPTATPTATSPAPMIAVAAPIPGAVTTGTPTPTHALVAQRTPIRVYTWQRTRPPSTITGLVRRLLTSGRISIQASTNISVKALYKPWRSGSILDTQHGGYART